MYNLTNYRPHKNKFPCRLLRYLHEHGKSSGLDAQEGIGLNKWFDSRSIILFDRASQNFNIIAKQLENKGLIKILPNDFFELTEVGKQFIENYNPR